MLAAQSGRRVSGRGDPVTPSASCIRSRMQPLRVAGSPKASMQERAGVRGSRLFIDIDPMIAAAE
jgi:hypothetical protein